MHQIRPLLSKMNARPAGRGDRNRNQRKKDLYHLRWHEIKARTKQPAKDSLHYFFVFLPSKCERIHIVDLILESLNPSVNHLFIRKKCRLRRIVYCIPNVASPLIYRFWCWKHINGQANPTWIRVTRVVHEEGHRLMAFAAGEKVCASLVEDFLCERM